MALAGWRQGQVSRVACVNVITRDDEVMLVVAGDLDATTRAELLPLRAWLGRQHCTDLVVDAQQVRSAAPSVISELREIALLVRIGGGTVAVIVESAAFAEARIDGGIGRTLERTTRHIGSAQPGGPRS